MKIRFLRLMWRLTRSLSMVFPFSAQSVCRLRPSYPRTSRCEPNTAYGMASKIATGAGVRAGRDHLLPEMIHLSFQAFFSFMNFASPGCTGTVGLALMPFACNPLKSRAKGVKPGSPLARLSR